MSDTELSTIQSPVIYELKEKIATLQNAILESHPTLPVLLRTIHTQLRNDPELVTCLDEEEIGAVVNGLKKQTNTEIATSVVKKSATASASLTKKIKAAGSSAVDLF